MADRGSSPHRRLLASHDDDPLSGVANLFDVAMVFAVAILLSLITRIAPLEAIASSGGKPGSEAILPDGEPLEHYRVSESQLSGEGERLGVAYRLANGEVVYVPSRAEDGRLDEP
ncbi:hypothetical protein Pla108_07650 [Botrimarina colliarenosi]|uniref:DUF2149 domain-containing protein n=1 Tax=Botrimarina colliarenosi TaxID=2528001 RepID=A0A5C6AIE3_9BACT|nr:DUF2149 domain-containing protein [Botrimarina colliarenosi]TWT99822.1 hypothetical protein Pla108_07650 [Botrimarina colliarenosi]